MNLHKNITLLRIALCVLAGVCRAQAEDVTQDELPELARKTAVEWTWGTSSNGIVSGFHVSGVSPGHDPEIGVYVHGEFHVSADSLPPTFYSEPNSNALPQTWFLKRIGDTNEIGMYFKATNLFCGPMTLRDADGVLVPPQNHDSISISAYPLSFRYSELGQRDDFHHNMAWPLVGRLPELAKFKLEDIFQMKKHDDYVLTVWPEVYRLVDTNGDYLYKRVDVPPVSVKIKWNGPPSVGVGTNKTNQGMTGGPEQ